MGSLFSFASRSNESPASESPASPRRDKTTARKAADSVPDPRDSGYHSHPTKKHRKRVRSLNQNNAKRARMNVVRDVISTTPPKAGTLKSFFQLLDDDVIQDLLWFDCNFLLLDNYLLAMVYAYFRRTELTVKDYTAINFFAALWLAWDMEEDDEDRKEVLLPWALGKNWKKEKHSLLRVRNELWKKMKFRGLVSKATCDEVMALAPGHPLWERKRRESYGGAVRNYAVTLSVFNEDIFVDSQS